MEETKPSDSSKNFFESGYGMPTEPMTRMELENYLEKIYVMRVIQIQKPDTTIVCGLLRVLAVDFDKNGEPICIIQVNHQRHEFALSYFIQKALIHGNSNGTE